MGGDGGSIANARVDMVKLKKQSKKPDEKEIARVRWTTCALSKEPLKPPLVADELGFIFNKEAVIKSLLNKSMPTGFRHIRSLKDVFPVNFKMNPSFKELEEKKSDMVIDVSTEFPFICPITGIEIGGTYKFSVIRTCGCAMSDRALKECHSEVCLVCGKPFKSQDVIPLNPDEEHRKELKLRLTQKSKSLGHKRKRENEEESSATDSSIRPNDVHSNNSSRNNDDRNEHTDIGSNSRENTENVETNTKNPLSTTSPSLTIEV